MEMIKVSAHSRSTSVAGAIAGTVREHRRAEVQAIGASAVNQALNSLERGGTILFFAPTSPDATVPLSINEVFWRTDVTLTTSYAGSPADYTTALKLIQAQRLPLGDMISHRLGLAETGLGFRLVSGYGESLKVIIEPQR